MPKTSHIVNTTSSLEYELLDSGEGEKLERFGSFILSRPDPQALWHKRLSPDEWKKADGIFTNTWKMKNTLPDKWQISFGQLQFWIRPSSFKHVGLFPEQVANWDWVREQLGNTSAQPEVLNLFGYTGGATLAAAKAGAKVVHVDGSKVALNWANENAELSGLKDKPMRWILDDAHAFVRREIKRGRTYDGIIMDPPSFGHGPNNELWKIEEHFLSLIDDCLKILSDTPLFFLINGYSSGYSGIAYENLLLPLTERLGGVIETGELTIKETKSTKEEAKSQRLLPCGIFARWSK